ncbi:zymogen granule membrane protein 16-like [Pelodiscus sinensis]|uniref:zymogen granule membrane protein 16-like n=1 Tax=Pelodiscus sinensis TaxID=13735 RepID=UPI003F6AA912
MLRILLLAAIGAVGRAQEQPVEASFSGLYGGTWGNEFSQTSYEIVGPITGMKIWSGSLTLHGIQVRYGTVWSGVSGETWGTMVEMDLQEGESVVQAQGSYSSWVVTSVTFTTSLGRTFVFGNQSGTSFLALPVTQGAVLRAISGRRLEQEKHELRRRLEAREAEWEMRAAELEGDLAALRAQLGHQRLEQQDTSRESSQALLQLSEQNQRLAEQLSQRLCLTYGK